MIIRTPKKAKFTVINNTLIDDPRLSWAALGMLVYLLSKPDNWKVMPAHLIRLRNLSRDGVYALLKELAAVGYVHKQQARNHAGRITSTDWYVFDEPHTPPSPPSGPAAGAPEPTVPEPVIPDEAIPDEAAPDAASPESLVKTEFLLKTETLPKTETTKHTHTNPFSKNHEHIPEQPSAGVCVNDDAVFAEKVKGEEKPTAEPEAYPAPPPSAPLLPTEHRPDPLSADVASIPRPVHPN